MRAELLFQNVTVTSNGWREAYSHRQPNAEAYEWHRRQPFYRPTPLICLPTLAASLGFEQIWVKDERGRFGTNSFKILGASWALHNALRQRATTDQGETHTLFAATDGNHGRAVAHLAARHRFSAEIYVPLGTSPDRIHAIETEGARVHVVNGSYDEAVRLAAATAECTSGGLLISDTAVSADDMTPEWAIQGYGTIFQEVEQAVPAGSEGAPDLVLVQIGVGGMAAAAARHFRTGSYVASAPAPQLVGVEPLSAACAAVSIAAGRLTSIEDDFDSTMVGLNAGTPSISAWNDLKYGFDSFLAISDAWCLAARANLASAGCEPGPTGLAGLAGLMALQTLRADGRERLPEGRRPLLLLSEGQ